MTRSPSLRLADAANGSQVLGLIRSMVASDQHLGDALPRRITQRKRKPGTDSTLTRGAPGEAHQLWLGYLAEFIVC
jgi:hypothetical protein